MQIIFMNQMKNLDVLCNSFSSIDNIQYFGGQLQSACTFDDFSLALR